MLRRQSAIQIKTNIESPLEKQPVRRSENIPPNAPLSLKGQSKSIKSIKSQKTIDTQLFSLQPIENPSGMPDIFYRRKPKSDSITPPLVPTQISFALVEQKQSSKKNQPDDEELQNLLLENEELRNKIQIIAMNEEQLKKNFADELETLTQAINSERQHFQQIEKEMKDEESRLKTLIAQLELKQSKNLQQKIDSKEKELLQIQKQLLEQKQKKDSLENEVNGLREKNDDLSKKINNLEEINIQKENEIKNLWDELNRTVKDWEKVQKQSQNQIQQRDQQILSLQKRITELDHLFNEQEKQIQFQDNRYNTLESLLKSKQHDELQDNVTEEIYQTKLNRIQNEKEELIQQLKEQEQIQRNSRQQIQQQEQMLLNKQKEFQESIKNLIQESENWKAKYLTLESEVQQNNQEQIFQQKRTFSLQFEKNELVQEIFDLKQCNENLQNQMGQMQAFYQDECNALVQQISHLQNVCQFKERQYTELKEQLQIQESNSQRSFTVDITQNMLLDIHDSKKQEETLFKPLEFQLDKNAELNKLRELLHFKEQESQQTISKLQANQDDLINQLNESQDRNQFLLSQTECMKQQLESIKFFNQNLEKEIQNFRKETENAKFDKDTIIQKLQSEIISKENVIELGQANITELNKQIENLSQNQEIQIETIRTQYNKVITSLNYENDMLIQQSRNINQQLQQLKQMLEESEQEIQQLRNTNLSYKNQIGILNEFLMDNQTIIKKLQSQIQIVQDENQNNISVNQSIKEQFEREKQFYVEQLANLSAEKKKMEEQLTFQEIIQDKYEKLKILSLEKDEDFNKQTLEYKSYKTQSENTIKELIQKIDKLEYDKLTEQEIYLNEKEQIISKNQIQIQYLEQKLNQFKNADMNHMKQIELLTQEIEKQNLNKTDMQMEWENQVKHRLEHEVRELVTQFVYEKDQLKREIYQLQQLLFQKQDNFEQSRITAVSERVYENCKKNEQSINLSQR